MSNNNCTALFFVLLLAGCGSNVEPGPPSQCDYHGDTGICIGADPGYVSAVTHEQLEEAYVFARECIVAAGYIPDPDILSISGPVVRLTTMELIVDGLPRHGITSLQTGQITFSQVIDPFLMLASMRHESIHYILWRYGITDPNLHRAHNHLAFNCDGL